MYFYATGAFSILSNVAKGPALIPRKISFLWNAMIIVNATTIC